MSRNSIYTNWLDWNRTKIKENFLSMLVAAKNGTKIFHLLSVVECAKKSFIQMEQKAGKELKSLSCMNCLMVENPTG